MSESDFDSDSADVEAAHSSATTDHETIRRWVEERDGTPAHVEATAEGDDPGLLRLQFPTRNAITTNSSRSPGRSSSTSPRPKTSRSSIRTRPRAGG